MFRYRNIDDDVHAIIMLRYDRTAAVEVQRQVSWRNGPWHGSWTYEDNVIVIRFNARFPDRSELKTTQVTFHANNRWVGQDGRGHGVVMVLMNELPSYHGSDPWYLVEEVE